MTVRIRSNFRGCKQLKEKGEQEITAREDILGVGLWDGATLRNKHVCMVGILLSNQGIL